VAQWKRNRLVIGRLVGSNPLSGWGTEGGVPEWLIGAVCKIAALTGFVGSNPTPSTLHRTIKVGIIYAHIAQQVEHTLGKGGVSSSILLVGL
jgi:hypothetical protein